MANGLLYYRRRKSKYDLIIAHDFRSHVLFLLLALIGFDVNGTYVHTFSIIFVFLFAWIVFVDISLFTLLHNLGVYKYRKKQKLAKKTKTKVERDSEESDKEREN